MKLIKKRFVKVFFVFVICTSLLVTTTADRAQAGLGWDDVLVAGLTVGEATYIAVATILAGGTMLDYFHNYKKDAVVGKIAVAGARYAWQGLSSTAKSAWAGIEAGIVASGDAIYNVMLTADQWAQATLGSILSWSTTQAYVPALPLPTKFESPGSNEYFTKYAILTMTFNGISLALMPTGPYNGTLLYEWFYYDAKSSSPRWNIIQSGKYIPSELSAFIPIRIYIWGSSQYPVGFYGVGQVNGAVTGITFNALNPEDAYKFVLDANVIVHELMVNRYGSLAPAFPQPWADVYPLPQAPTRDRTKPLPIPVPTGSISYPQTGTGQLDLPGTAIKTGAESITGSKAEEGTGEGVIDKVIDFFDLTKPIKWDKIKAIPKGVTTAFPFSLPWDIGRMINALTVPPERPKLVVEVLVNGKKTSSELPIGPWLDPFVPIIRSSTLFVWTLGLVFATNKFFGAQK